MRKIVAAINTTLDAVCDHTVGIPDEEVHDHYRGLITDADAILFGRITFELMKYWQTLVAEPSGERSMDDFARAIDKIPKIVFSHSLSDPEWDSARVSQQSLRELVAELKQKPGKDILIGSRSLIVQLTNLDLVDELQLCLHPVIAGKGLPLFGEIAGMKMLKLMKTKIFNSGVILLYYERG